MLIIKLLCLNITLSKQVICCYCVRKYFGMFVSLYAIETNECQENRFVLEHIFHRGLPFQQLFCV